MESATPGISPGQIPYDLAGPLYTWTPSPTATGHTPTATATPSPVYGDIVINEFAADPNGVFGIADFNRDGVRDGSQDEFIEIYNNSDTPVDLTGWSISDSSRVRHVFASGTLLPGRAWAVVFGGGQPTGFVHACTADDGELGLSGTSDTITLRNNAGEMIDAINYAPDTPVVASNGGVTARLWDAAPVWQVRDNPADATVERSNVLNPNATLTPTPTGGIPTSTPSPTENFGNVVVNEFCADPQDALNVTHDYNRDGLADTKDDEFIEVYNNSALSVDLSGWSLADGTRTRHVFVPGTVLPGHTWLVVLGGGNPQGFSRWAIASTGDLGLNNETDTIALRNNHGAAIDSLVYSLAGSIQVSNGGSTARIPDGGPNWYKRAPAQVTPGQPNSP
jgi:predicted extracellular nuclease